MEGPRPVRSDELESLSELVDSTFKGYPGGMRAAFPLLFHSSNLSHLWVVKDKGRIVSHSGVHVAEVVIYGCRLKMASIGSVATYEEYRGKGLATGCLREIEAQVVAEGASVINISGARGLYDRFGAVKVGRAFVCSVPAAGAVGQTRIRRAAAGDISSLERLYECEPVRYHRPLDEWRALFEGMSHGAPYRQSCIYLVDDSEGAVGYVHVIYGERGGGQFARASECAGCRGQIVDSLPRIAREVGADSIELRAPDYDAGLVRAARTAGFKSKVDFLTHHTMKVAAPGIFVRDLKPYFEERLGRAGAGALAFQPGAGGSYDVIIGEERMPLDTPAFTALAFGCPESAADEEERFLDRIFPVPLPLPGLNYV